MKKDLKVILMTGIASVLTATIIFISGGGVVIATLLGGTGILTIPSAMYLNDKRNNKNNTHYLEQLENIQSNNQVINQDKEIYLLSTTKIESKSRQSIAPIKQYDDNLITKSVNVNPSQDVDFIDNVWNKVKDYI
mgnify:CR=1 FL=1